MKETKAFFTSGNRLNKGYSRISSAREDNSFYRKKFEHILPPLDIISEYENIHPGTLARLVDMAEKEQHHRQAVDFATLENNQRTIKRGQIFAMILVVFMCLTTLILSIFATMWVVFTFVVLSFLPISVTAMLPYIKACKEKLCSSGVKFR